MFYNQITNNGTFGGSGGDGISLEMYNTVSSMTITGTTGTTTIGRIRAYYPATGTITIDQNVTLTGSSAVLTLFYDNAGNTTGDNPTLTINSGKTVTLNNTLGALHKGSATSTNPSGSYTYNINGTLDLSACTGAISYLIPLSNTGTVTFNIASTGTLKLASASTVNSGTYSGSIAINNSGNIFINGNLANNASISGTGTTTFNGSSAQTISNTGTISNMVVSNSSNVYVNPTAVLNISTSLNTNNQLVLSSDATGTGSIGNDGGGAITGNVTVQRYVGTSQQWRMVGFPFGSGKTINASDLATLYGSGYNAYTYTESADDGTNYNGANGGAVNAGWASFTGSATTTADKGILLTGGSPTTIVSATGTLNSGTQTITLSSTTGKGWNLIANPFASNITWSTVQGASTNVDPTVYRYNPNTTGYSSYNSGTSTSSDGNQTNVIENGAGFFVHVTSPGSAASLSVAEAAKTTSAPGATLFGTNQLQHGNLATEDGFTNITAATENKSIIRLTLLKESEVYGDAVVLRWGGGYAATENFDPQFDAYDLGRSKGADLSVIGNDKTSYSIFHGSELKNSSEENRTVQLGIKNIEEGNYQMGIQLLSAIAGGNKAYLFDSYTNQYTLIDGSTNNYNFLVTSDPKSQSATRFAVVMNYKAPDNTINTNLPVMLLNNPSSGNLFSLYSKNNYTQLQWQIVDGAGRLMQAGSLNNVLKGGTYQINGGNTRQGSYFIKLTGDGNALPVLKALKN